MSICVYRTPPARRGPSLLDDESRAMADVEITHPVPVKCLKVELCKARLETGETSLLVPKLL